MADLYKNIEVVQSKTPKSPVPQKAYRGISTVNPNNNTFQAYDLSLIKQDLLNHFHIRQGEKLENPTFGTIIWDALYEPLTEELKEAIAKNVTNIVNYDPRTRANKIVVDSYEHGLQIECQLTYVPYNISEVLKIQFDKENGLIT